MDKTEQYIKMSDCPEVQKYRKGQKDFQIGDCIANYLLGKYSKANFQGIVVFEQHDEIRDRQLAVWLPRQDDIQGMLIKEKFGDFSAHWDICVEIPMQFVAKNPTLELSSMEQIWLSCYMLSIHQKVWSSEEEKWVKKWDLLTLEYLSLKDF